MQKSLDFSAELNKNTTFRRSFNMVTVIRGDLIGVSGTPVLCPGGKTHGPRRPESPQETAFSGQSGPRHQGAEGAQPRAGGAAHV